MLVKVNGVTQPGSLDPLKEALLVFTHSHVGEAFHKTSRRNKTRLHVFISSIRDLRDVVNCI